MPLAQRDPMSLTASMYSHAPWLGLGVGLGLGKGWGEGWGGSWG